MKRLILLTTLAGLAGVSRGQESTTNLALAKTYRLEPAPNYSHCTDAGDRTQLTDGQYTQGYFWTQKGTVGWAGQSLIIITLDFEDDLEKQGVRNDTLASARKLLDTAADRVTACMTSSALLHWKEPKDRTVADRVRVEILESLTQLAEP